MGQYVIVALACGIISRKGNYMTAIAAIVENNIVYIGGDSAGVGDLLLEIRKDPKVFINGQFIIGFTSSFRMGQLLQYSFVPPEHPRRMGIDKFMNTIFVNAIRKCFADGGYLGGYPIIKNLAARLLLDIVANYSICMMTFRLVYP